MINFIVDDQSILYNGITEESIGDPLVTNTFNNYVCHFEFNDIWEGYTKTAIFMSEFDGKIKKTAIILDENDECTIPLDAIKNQGKLRVGIYGSKEDKSIPTIYSSRFLVRLGAFPEEEPTPEEKTLYQQLLERYNQAFELIQELSGGSKNQVLHKESDDDWDFTWADADLIQSISVNGEVQPIIDGNVDIEIPEPEESVTDVQINGTSIVDENGIADIPMATSGKLGVSKPHTTAAMQITADGKIYHVPANISDIDNRAANYKTIPSSLVDYAVKAALTDGKGEEYTESEKSAARERIGAGVGDVSDVQVNGASVVTDGVADVPVAAGGAYGLARYSSAYGMSVYNGFAMPAPATAAQLASRATYNPITGMNLDDAVKAAMTDGIGAEWTDAEKAAARARMDADGGQFEVLAEITLEEDAPLVAVNFTKPVKHLQIDADIATGEAASATLYVMANNETLDVRSIAIFPYSGNANYVGKFRAIILNAYGRAFSVGGYRAAYDYIPVAVNYAARNAGGYDMPLLNKITLKTTLAFPAGTVITVRGVYA